VTKQVLAAFDKCKDSLAAGELCNLTQKTLESRGSGFRVQCMPLSDGGEGFVDILTKQASGSFSPFYASDSLGFPKEILIGLCELRNLPALAKESLGLPNDGRIGIIEMASIVGLADLKMEQRDAWKTCTRGVGEALAHCSSLELDAILLGIGGSSTNDMGVGALSALGLDFSDSHGCPISFPTPEKWSSVSTIESRKMVPLPPLIIACDVRNPLLGTQGATHQFGKQKGLTKEARKAMEQEMEKMLALMSSLYPDAVTGSHAEGSGAAGGIGFGLGLAYEVKFVPGFELISSWYNLGKKLEDCEILITGEGRFDQTSSQGKAPFELMKKAHELGKESFVFAGSVDDEMKIRCELEYPGVKIYEFGNRSKSLADNLAHASSNLVRALNQYIP